MCNNCEIVRAAFSGAKTEPHLNYLPINALLSAMLEQHRLELYAGDCPFDKMTEVLESEKHYTVCFYFKCTECDRLYFFGACVRGAPVFKVIDDISLLDIGICFGEERELIFRRSEPWNKHKNYSAGGLSSDRRATTAFQV